MTVLRSREIKSKSKSKSPHQKMVDKSTTTTTTTSIDPSTPPKMVEVEPSNVLLALGGSPHSDSRISPPLPPPPPPIRRRSLRLASKSNSLETILNSPPTNIDDGVFHLGMNKVRVSAAAGTSANNNLSECGIIAMEEKILVSAPKPKGKRKLAIDSSSSVKLMEEGEDEGSNLRLLRSGTKIAKKRVESDGGWKSVHENNEGLDTDKEREGMLLNNSSGWSQSGQCAVMNELERDQRYATTRGSGSGSQSQSQSQSQSRSGRISIGGDKAKAKAKDKGKLVNEESFTPNGVVEALDLELRLGGVEKSTGNAVSDTTPICLFGNAAFLMKSDKIPNNDGSGSSSSSETRRRLSREEKGKDKMAEDASFLLKTTDSVGVGLNTETKPENLVDKVNVLSTSIISLAEKVVPHSQVTNTRVDDTRRREYKERFRDIARQNASRFAHFSVEEEEEEEEDNHVTDGVMDLPSRETEREIEDWPGPFSTAMKIIRDRKMNVSVQQHNSSMDQSKPASLVWVPKADHHHGHSKQLVPSLQELSMRILVKNADAITSLDSVPDVLRHKLSQLLCDSRKMNGHFLDLLASGSPTEVRVRDCSWLTEEQFTRTFKGCKTDNLTVLQLDQCGRCMPDYILLTTLARSPNNLPALTSISLKGACRLSDAGLSSLVSSAPALRSINLSQCSLLTFKGISALTDSLGMVLRELYLDDCQITDPMLILPALKKLERLEVLSLAGIQSISDEFIHELITVRGPGMRELVLADCVKLTDSSLKVIGETCSGLCALDLVNLCKLTDSAVGFLANGCQAIQTLKLCRNSFSDEAVAAFLETSGESLKELSLNNVIKVGQNTAISLARRSRKLHCLDLSWCRNLTNEALGLIVDSCLSLKVLKLFGCSQITEVFLNGHSNPQVQIVGLKMTPILEHLKTPDPLEGPLHYSSVSAGGDPCLVS